MPTILVTGGSGLIGTALTKLLVENGYEVIVLTRSVAGKSSPLPGVSFAAWDVKLQNIDKKAVAAADHIIHLAGAGVADERWTEERKKEILDSRTQSGNLLVESLKTIPNKVQSVISASAIGWYGEDAGRLNGKNAFTEDMPADGSFLGETCKLWEESITPVSSLGKRLVIVRTGIVLSNDGGAFKSFKQPIKFGIAAVLNNGKQVISWIHIDDICRFYLYALQNNISGVFNGVAPNPVSNKDFTQALATKMKGSFYVPIYVPSFLLKIGLGQMSIEVLKSTTVSSAKTSATGFNFTYSKLDGALTELCSH